MHTAARLVVSVHDVSPATEAQTRRWCADADALGVRVSLLVIPGPWRGASLADCPDYAPVLRERAGRGDEIVLHGWTHAALPGGSAARRAVARVVARGAAEFAAIDTAEATERLDAGRTVLSGLGLAVTGFTPPGWLASPGAVRALSDTGFAYLTTHRGLWRLPQRRLEPAFALSNRPVGGVTERLGSQLMHRWARRGARRGALVRIALHPDDLSRPGLRDRTLRAIESVLAAGGTALTYGELAANAAGADAEVTA
jgi:predicted deacetylase